jgi:hypothetical protein
MLVADLEERKVKRKAAKRKTSKQQKRETRVLKMCMEKSFNRTN